MPLSRRKFVQGSLAAGMVIGSATFNKPQRTKAASANEKIRVGVMGLGRGKSLVQTFASSPNAIVEYVCDVDSRRIPASASVANKAGGNTPQQVTDFRKVLDDKSIDAVVIATPDHWHAPMTMLACAAGKHVYCEKPASHNAQEGEWLIESARKHNRVVQLGTQRRSEPSFIEAVGKLHSGAIGKLLLAQGHYYNPRPSIGYGKAAPVPTELDYSLWQGPAPEREYRDNLIHYNWHWLWHWGTAELGNNGVHLIDIARWGLQVEFPQSITCSGGRYRYQDDQETPDTSVTTYEFGDKQIVWQQRSFYKPLPIDKQPEKVTPFELEFHGDAGTITCNRTNWTQYDLDGQVVAAGKHESGDHYHVENFISCIRENKRPNADIEIGVRSTQLCHYGNMAWRTGKTLHLDSTTHKPTDAEAMKYWAREYRRGWEPVV